MVLQPLVEFLVWPSCKKKNCEKIWHILKICFKVKKVFEITLFYGI
jgi:hypothetical protein